MLDVYQQAISLEFPEARPFARFLFYPTDNNDDLDMYFNGLWSDDWSRLYNNDGNYPKPGTGPIVSYAWDFGDGESSSLPFAVHRFPRPGVYTVSLTVTDEDGLTDTFVEEIGKIGFLINAGLNDAWYNPDTSGQGFFINVFPNLGVVSLAWFTYDTELPPMDATANLGDPGHRWLTALGPITGNQVIMDIELTSGGIFDTATEITRTDPPGSDGTLVLTFDSCNSGTIEYNIPSINRQGTVPIQRVANDNVVLCEALR